MRETGTRAFGTEATPAIQVSVEELEQCVLLEGKHSNDVNG